MSCEHAEKRIKLHESSEKVTPPPQIKRRPVTTHIHRLDTFLVNVEVSAPVFNDKEETTTERETITLVVQFDRRSLRGYWGKYFITPPQQNDIFFTFNRMKGRNDWFPCRLLTITETGGCDFDMKDFKVLFEGFEENIVQGPVAKTIPDLMFRCSHRNGFLSKIMIDSPDGVTPFDEYDDNGSEGSYQEIFSELDDEEELELYEAETKVADSA